MEHNHFGSTDGCGIQRSGRGTGRTPKGGVRTGERLAAVEEDGDLAVVPVVGVHAVHGLHLQAEVPVGHLRGSCGPARGSDPPGTPSRREQIGHVGKGRSLMYYCIEK